MTGVTNLNAELEAKRLRLATRPNWTGSPPNAEDDRDVGSLLPRATRFALLINTGNPYTGSLQHRLELQQGSSRHSTAPINHQHQGTLREVVASTSPDSDATPDQLARCRSSPISLPPPARPQEDEHGRT